MASMDVLSLGWSLFVCLFVCFSALGWKLWTVVWLSVGWRAVHCCLVICTLQYCVPRYVVLPCQGPPLLPP